MCDETKPFFSNKPSIDHRCTVRQTEDSLPNVGWRVDP